VSVCQCVSVSVVSVVLNDKYRILSVIHRVIESLRPGATGQRVVPTPEEVQAHQRMIEKMRATLLSSPYEEIRRVAKNLE